MGQITITDASGDLGRRAWNQLHNRLLPAWAETFDEHMHESRWAPASEQAYFSAAVDGIPCGIASVQRDVWAVDQSRLEGLMFVGQEHRGIGVGSQLLTAVATWGRDHGYEGLGVQAYDDDAASLAFWQDRGFRVVERYCDSELDLTSRAAGDGPDADAPCGLLITSLAEQPALYRAHYEILQASVVDIPAEERFEPPPFEHWLQQMQTSPRHDPAASFVALLDGEPAGIADLELRPAQPGVLWHGFTAVDPRFRRRGVARALKLRAIDWADGYGARLLRTENEERNVGMRALNHELGYRVVATRDLLHGALDQQLP